jgi:hypothetical protein
LRPSAGGEAQLEDEDRPEDGEVVEADPCGTCAA